MSMTTIPVELRELLERATAFGRPDVIEIALDEIRQLLSEQPQADHSAQDLNMVEQPQAGDGWPKLERQAKVGAGLFAAGVSARLVVEAAYRQNEYASDPPYTPDQVQALRNAFGEQPQAGAGQNPDDAAVDRFAIAMKSKLAKSREKGRHGWQNATAPHLGSLLYEHMYKGDPLDVANLAMMLHQNGQAIELPHDARRQPAARHDKGDEVRRLREALEHARYAVERGEYATGCCCCGNSVASHGLGDGHSPVDEGDYFKLNVLKDIDAALTQSPKGEEE